MYYYYYFEDGIVVGALRKLTKYEVAYFMAAHGAILFSEYR